MTEKQKNNRMNKKHADTNTEAKRERIAKVMARAGLCSRREAERWIEAGRVRVNGETLSTPAFTVIASDTVIVDNKPMPVAQETRLWRYHKPPGLLTSHNDPEGRATVFEKMPPEMPRVVSVGRLDINSEGLLLLTNDGELARRLELPETGWTRRYRVRVHGIVKKHLLEKLIQGITIEGVRYGPVEATLDSTQRANSWLTVSINEGKNREVRRVMEHMDLQVTRLIRLSYGPFQLGKLGRGSVSEITGKALREQLSVQNPPEKKARANSRKRARSQNLEGTCTADNKPTKETNLDKINS